MSDNDMYCIFCEEDLPSNIVKFTCETFKKCKTVSEYRRSKPRQRRSHTTYNNIKFPPEPSVNQGYHAKCYKLFTAIKVPADFQKPQQNSVIKSENALEVSGDSYESHVPVTSTTEAADVSLDEAGESSNSERGLKAFDSDTNEPADDTSLPPVECFICDKSHKRLRGREVPLAVCKIQTIELLKSAATELNDVEMLEKISFFNDDSSIPYHKCCKDQYLRDISKVKLETVDLQKGSIKHVIQKEKPLGMDLSGQKKLIVPVAMVYVNSMDTGEEKEEKVLKKEFSDEEVEQLDIEEEDLGSMDEIFAQRGWANPEAIVSSDLIQELTPTTHFDADSSLSDATASTSAAITRKRPAVEEKLDVIVELMKKRMEQKEAHEQNKERRHKEFLAALQSFLNK